MKGRHIRREGNVFPTNKMQRRSTRRIIPLVIYAAFKLKLQFHILFRVCFAPALSDTFSCQDEPSFGESLSSFSTHERKKVEFSCSNFLLLPASRLHPQKRRHSCYQRGRKDVFRGVKNQSPANHCD